MRSDKSKDIVAGDRDYETCVLEAKEADEITVDKKSEKDKKENMSKKTNNRVKRNSAMDWAFRVIIFCLVCVIVISGYKVGTALYKYHHSRSGFKQVAKEAKVDPNQFTGVVDFAALQKINPDVVGWIYQKDTIINYPIMHGSIYTQISTRSTVYLVRFLWIIGIVLTSLISIRLSMVIICMTAVCSSR